jgi:hypothetical protein
MLWAMALEPDSRSCPAYARLLTARRPRRAVAQYTRWPIITSEHLKNRRAGPSMPTGPGTLDQQRAAWEEAIARRETPWRASLAGLRLPGTGPAW